MNIPSKSVVKNPLGIISLFVFFIEAIATVSLRIVIDSIYVGHIVWFIILFPTLIVILFFTTLWTKRECLYSPMEFREDKSFLNLLDKKLDRLETRQHAAGIDLSTTELSEVITTIDRMLSLNDLYGAVELSRAYLKKGKFDESTELFTYLKNKTHPKTDGYFNVLSNLAYSLIGKEKYQEAITELLIVKEQKSFVFRAWHFMAMAYCYYKLGDTKNYEKWLKIGKNREEYERAIPHFRKLYPEIIQDF